MTSEPELLRLRNIRTALYYTSLVAFGLMVSSIGPALPTLAKQTGVSLSAIGVLFTTHGTGFLLGSLIGGRLYDRMPGHPIIAVVLVLSAAMTLLVPLTGNLPILAGIFLVAGAGVGALNVGGNTSLVWTHREGVGPWMTGLHLVTGLGSLLAPIIVTQSLNRTGDIKQAFWLIGLLALLPAPWLLRTSSPVRDTGEGTANDAPMNYRLVLPFAMVFLCYVGAEVGFNGWIFTFTLELHPGEETTAGYLNAAFWAALAVGRIIIIRMASGITTRTIVSGSLVGAIASMAVIIVGAKSIPVIAVGTVGFGLSHAAIFPTLLAFVGTLMPISGKVTGFFFSATSIGSMTVPWIMSQLIEPAGPQAAMSIVLATEASMLAIFIWIAYFRHPSPRKSSPGAG